MNDYLYLFRIPSDLRTMLSPEAMQAHLGHWGEWMGGLAQAGKLQSGLPADTGGQMVYPGGRVTDGAYTAENMLVGGYIVIKAADIAEATEIAHGCPALDHGGNVEVRQLMPMR